MCICMSRHVRVDGHCRGCSVSRIMTYHLRRNYRLRGGQRRVFSMVVRGDVNLSNPVEFSCHVFLSLAELLNCLPKTLGKLWKLLCPEHDQHNEKNDQHIGSG